MRLKPRIVNNLNSLHTSVKALVCSGIYLFLILGWFTDANAQTAVKTTQSEVENYFSLAKNHFSNFDSAEFYLNEALKTGRELSDDFIIAKALDYKGLIRHNAMQFNEALKYYKQAYEVASKLEPYSRMGSITLHMGVTYDEMGELDSAILFTLESIHVREQINDTLKIANPYNNLASYYGSLGRVEDAIEAYEKSTYFFLKASKIQDYLTTMANWASVLMIDSRYEQALDIANEALDHKCDDCSEVVEATLLQKKAVAMFRLGIDTEVTKKTFEESLRIMIANSAMPEFQAATLRFLAMIELKEGNVSDYLTLMDESTQLALDNRKLEQLRENYREFSRYHQSAEDYENALHFHQLYVTIQDSLMGPHTMKNVDRVLMDDLRRKSDRLIQEQRAAIQTKDRENQLMKIIGGLFLALMAGGWRALYLINKKNKTIECQNSELQEYNDSLKVDMVQRTSELEETSKVLDNFIYRTSHDIRGPIASLKGLSNVAQLEVSDPVAREYFSRIRTTADNMEYVLDGLREVNKVKYAEISVEEFDLKQVILNSIEVRKESRNHVGVTFNNVDKVHLNSDAELTFTAIDKIIDNAFKFHSLNASTPEVFIHAFKYNGGVKIRISDNGIGIDEEKVEYIFGLFERASDQSQFGGIGLYVSKLALSRLGGAIRADRDFKKGLTTFEIYLPNLKISS